MFYKSSLTSILMKLVLDNNNSIENKYTHYDINKYRLVVANFHRPIMESYVADK